MKQFFQILLCFFLFGFSFGQEKTIQIKLTYIKSIYSYKDLNQFTFNKEGDILENTTVYINNNKPDTTSQILYKYKNSKLIERKIYHDKNLILNEKHTYKKSLLNTTHYLDGSKLELYYDSNKNLTSNVITKGLDTLRKITYKYKKKDLVELFRFSNTVDKEKRTYKKSQDTLIETIHSNDSTYQEKPRIIIKKKKLNSQNLLIYSSDNPYENYLEEKNYTYNNKNQLIQIDVLNSEDNSTSKERYFFTYENEFLNKIERQELIENNWITLDSMLFESKISSKKPSKKTIKKINDYLLKEYLE